VSLSDPARRVLKGNCHRANISVSTKPFRHGPAAAEMLCKISFQPRVCLPPASRLPLQESLLRNPADDLVDGLLARAHDVQK